MTENQKEEWEMGTSELYRAIGEFVVKFEHVRHAIQICIMALLKRAGLQDQGVVHIVTAHLTAGPLRELFQSLVKHFQTQLNSKEQKILKIMLVEFDALTEKRNELVHSMWLVGWGDENTTDFSVAEGVKSAKKEAIFKTVTLEAKELRELSKRADTLASQFQRLNGCFVFGHSVERNFVLSADEKHVSVPA